MAACVGALLVWGSVHGWTTRRHYLISPLDGVAEVDLRDNMDFVAVRVVDKKQVAALVAFMNARRDNWYDPEGQMFGMDGDLEFLDAHKQRRASVSFGPGGMMLTRPDMTYRDSVKVQEFLVFRTHGDTEHDAVTLCALLSSALHRAACDRPGELIQDMGPRAHEPDDCDEPSSRRPPPRHIALPPRSDV